MSKASSNIIVPPRTRIRTRWQRHIVMPPGMEPEWLAPQYRDNYVMRCIKYIEMLLACEKCRKRRLHLMHIMRNFKLRKFQRGNFNIFPAGTQAVLDANCSFTASTIPNLSDFDLGGTGWTAARLHSDGDWYSNSGSAGFGTSEGTWQGGCAIADYDTRWELTNAGDPPNYLVSGTDGTWSAATTSKAVGYTGSGFTFLSGTFDLECRDGTTLAVLFVDSFQMSVTTEL